jgi:hypothetical protein
MNKDGYLTRDPLDPVDKVSFAEKPVLLQWDLTKRICPNLAEHEESYATHAQIKFSKYKMHRSMIDCTPFKNEQLEKIKLLYDSMAPEKQSVEIIMQIMNLEEEEQTLRAQAYAFSWCFLSKDSQDHIRSKKRTELLDAASNNDFVVLRKLARSTHLLNRVLTESNYLVAQKKFYKLSQGSLLVHQYNRLYEIELKNFKESGMTEAESDAMDKSPIEKERYTSSLNDLFNKFPRDLRNHETKEGKLLSLQETMEYALVWYNEFEESYERTGRSMSQLLLDKGISQSGGAACIADDDGKPSNDKAVKGGAAKTDGDEKPPYRSSLKGAARDKSKPKEFKGKLTRREDKEMEDCQLCLTFHGRHSKHAPFDDCRIYKTMSTLYLKHLGRESNSPRSKSKQLRFEDDSSDGESHFLFGGASDYSDAWISY